MVSTIRAYPSAVKRFPETKRAKVGYVNGVDYGSTSTCSPTWTGNKNGLDNGYVTVVVMAAATRAANNAQYWFEYKWALYPSGNTVLLYSGIVYY